MDIRDTFAEMLSRKVMCPYCLAKISTNSAKYNCSFCGTDITKQGFNGKYYCPDAAHRDKPVIISCPICGRELPSSIFDYDEYMRFCLLGATDTGKTNFLITMIHELQHCKGTYWSCSHMDQETLENFHHNEDTIYKEHRPVDNTLAGQGPQPQQWILQNGRKRTKTSIPTYSLTIFDGAGEDVTAMSEDIKNYINGSNTLVILFDPLMLDTVAQRMDPEKLAASTGTYGQGQRKSAAELVTDITTYIKAAMKLKPNQLINRNVAVVFTKFDMVLDEFGTGTVTQESPHLKSGGFVLSDCEAVDEEIRSWIERNGGVQFLKNISNNFIDKNVKYFGISSFGAAPRSDGLLDEISPHRILDPLMWMMYNEGIIGKAEDE